MIRTVPPGAFVPPPKVESALVRVVPRRTPLLPPEAEDVFLRLVRAGFRQRRKTFLNSLSRSGSPVPAEAVAETMESLSLPDRVRAEAISFEKFLRLGEILGRSGKGGGQ